MSVDVTAWSEDNGVNLSGNIKQWQFLSTSRRLSRNIRLRPDTIRGGYAGENWAPIGKEGMVSNDFALELIVWTPSLESRRPEVLWRNNLLSWSVLDHAMFFQRNG